MDRRGFMKALAVSPVGMVKRDEGANCSGFVRHYPRTEDAPDGRFVIIYDDDDEALARLDKSAMALWGAESDGRKTVTTIHNDGYDVRFI